jgi:hypothetical protein
MRRATFYIGAVMFWVGAVKLIAPGIAFPWFSNCSMAGHDVRVCGPGAWPLAPLVVLVGVALVLVSVILERRRGTIR